MTPAAPTTASMPFISSSWTSKMAKLLLIPENEESLVVPALVLKATDYWPRIFLHALWRELQAGDNQGRRLLRVTYSGLDLVYIYEYPSAASGEGQVTQEDFTPELRLKQLLDTLGVRRYRVPPYACTSFVIGHIMHAYIVNSRLLRKRISPRPSSRFKTLCNTHSTFNIDPQNSSITTFRFCSEDAHYSDLSNVQISSGFVMTSRLLQEGRPLIERVLVGNPQRNTTHTYSETGDQYRPRLDEYAQEQRSPMPRNEMHQHSLISNTVPVNSGRSASTTLPSLARSSCDEDVFTEAKPQPIDQAKFGYRGDLDGGLRAQAGSWGDIIRSLPTLSSDSSGSSISTLATPASPSPAPRHVRRVQSRLSLPAPTPTPAAGEPSRRAHARMSLMCPLPTPGDASARKSRTTAYRKSLDLSEIARCRLWDVKSKDKENSEYVKALPRRRL